jgi:hypothetical protein
MKPQPSLVDVNPEALRLWCPVDAVVAENRPAIEWMDLQGVEFKEPFFNETLARVDAQKNRRRVVTEIDTLLQFEQICDGLSPSGFIFHSSRCGSTLVANSCRALNGSTVISEAPVVDKMISRFYTDAPPGSTKELLYTVLLRSTVAALGQRLKGDEARYFVKFSCTSTLQIQRIRRIWPNVPFLFLYRNPVEIIVSNLKVTPEWMQPQSNPATAAAIVGVEEDQLESLSPEEYCARSLRRFFSAVDTADEDCIKLCDYKDLSFESLIAMVRFCGIEPSVDEMDAIEKLTRLYSKDSTGTQLFKGDSATKRNAASEAVLVMAQKWAQAAYQRLNDRSS